MPSEFGYYEASDRHKLDSRKSQIHKRGITSINPINPMTPVTSRTRNKGENGIILGRSSSQPNIEIMTPMKERNSKKKGDLKMIYRCDSKNKSMWFKKKSENKAFTTPNKDLQNTKGLEELDFGFKDDDPKADTKAETDSTK